MSTPPSNNLLLHNVCFNNVVLHTMNVQICCLIKLKLNLSWKYLENCKSSDNKPVYWTVLVITVWGFANEAFMLTWPGPGPLGLGHDEILLYQKTLIMKSRLLKRISHTAVFMYSYGGKMSMQCSWSVVCSSDVAIFGFPLKTVPMNGIRLTKMSANFPYCHQSFDLIDSSSNWDPH